MILHFIKVNMCQIILKSVNPLWSYYPNKPNPRGRTHALTLSQKKSRLYQAGLIKIDIMERDIPPEPTALVRRRMKLIQRIGLWIQCMMTCKSNGVHDKSYFMKPPYQIGHTFIKILNNVIQPPMCALIWLLGQNV